MCVLLARTLKPYESPAERLAAVLEALGMAEARARVPIGPLVRTHALRDWRRRLRCLAEALSEPVAAIGASAEGASCLVRGPIDAGAVARVGRGVQRTLASRAEPALIHVADPAARAALRSLLVDGRSLRRVGDRLPDGRGRGERATLHLLLGIYAATPSFVRALGPVV